MSKPTESHFNQAAKSWDTPDKIKMAHNYATKIKEIIRKEHFKKVLEIGCGTGLLGENFISSDNQYVGVDTSEVMLEVLHEKFLDKSVKTYLLNLDVDEIPEDGFDLVVSSMAFHHLVQPGQTLKRLAPKVSKGGYLAIVDLCTEDGTFHPDPKSMGVHHFGFSEQEVSAWANAAGLKFQQYSQVHVIEKNEKKYPLFLAVFLKA